MLITAPQWYKLLKEIVYEIWGNFMILAIFPMNQKLF